MAASANALSNAKFQCLSSPMIVSRTAHLLRWFIYGARPDNDLLAMIDEFAPRIHFAHLRQVLREADGSFYEAEHLRGSSDMVGVIRALLREESGRRRARRPDHQIPMRPDHGHLLADDINKKNNPGYSYVGRLKGLAELRRNGGFEIR
jgi:mannonate dehydratase